jgi:hypothetical protein
MSIFSVLLNRPLCLAPLARKFGLISPDSSVLTLKLIADERSGPGTQNPTNRCAGTRMTDCAANDRSCRGSTQRADTGTLFSLGERTTRAANGKEREQSHHRKQS